MPKLWTASSAVLQQILLRPSGDATFQDQETIFRNALSQEIIIAVFGAAAATRADDHNRCRGGLDGRQCPVEPLFFLRTFGRKGIGFDRSFQVMLLKVPGRLDI